MSFQRGLCVLALLCWSRPAQGIIKTRIQDTLYNADGTLANGFATVSWKAFSAPDGSTIAANSLTLRIINGVLQVDLAPNPPGTGYTVLYVLEGRSASTETWVVPQSAAALRLSQVRVAGPAASSGTNAAPANLYASGGNTGIGPAAFTPSGTLEVYDATGAAGVTRQILRAGAGQGANPLLEFHFDTGPNAVGFRVPPLSRSTTYTLPAQDGLPGNVLRTDGAGTLSWSQPQLAGSGIFYQTFQNSGASLPQRDAANFSNGLRAVDNAGLDRTDISPVYGNTANTITQGNDPRLSDARTPLPHAATHAAGGSDPVAPGSIGALKNTSDTISTGGASNIGLVVKGAPGQAASLQEWHDSSDNLLASITSTGRVFFPEAFFSAPSGNTATSLFFQVNGLSRFSMTTFANAYNFNRYDDAGNFKDTPLQIVRSGDTLINTSLAVNDPTPATGATRVRVIAGAGQGATNLQEWQNSSGTILSSVDANGFFQLPAGQRQGTGTKVQFFNGTQPAADDCAKFDAGGNIVTAGGSCGSVHVPVFQDAETPAGTINGANAVFTLAAAPSPPGSLELTRNGVVQKPGPDFSLSGNTITFTASAIPQPGDTLLAWYRAGVTPPSSAAGGDLTGTYPNPSVGQVGGVTAANIASGASAANAAASANTANAIVKRDASGNFSAGTITANLSGNATNVTGIVGIGNGGTNAASFTAGQIIRMNAAGTALESSGKLAPAGAIVGDSDAQTLSNKTLNAPILAGNLGGNLQLGTNSLLVQFTNEGTTGTTINRLAKLTGSPSTAVMASSADTSGVVGVVVSGAGTSGPVQIATRGQVSCDFDGPTAAGDYVGISPTTGGKCRDAGAVYPASGQVLGRVLSTNAAAGTYAMQLFGPEVQGRAGGTVTSVGLSMPAEFVVSNSPVTSSGTLAVSRAAQPANQVMAGPTSGAAAVPTFRPLVAADVPPHAATHQNGGSDEVATATPAASAIPKADATGRLAPGWTPLLISNANQGYFFGVSVAAPETSGATAAFSANEHRVWQFVLPFPAAINQITFEVVTASGAGKSLGLGLWDASCSNLLLNSGVMTAGGSPDINTTGIKVKALSGGPVTLNAGVYWLAMTTDSTTLTLRSFALPSTAINLLNNGATKLFADAGNGGTSGAFPASCGTLTTAISNQPPMALFAR
jgi:hypothetical protein